MYELRSRRGNNEGGFGTTLDYSENSFQFDYILNLKEKMLEKSLKLETLFWGICPFSASTNHHSPTLFIPLVASHANAK